MSRRTRFGLALGVLALATAACGSAGPDAAAPTSAPSATTAAATETTIQGDSIQGDSIETDTTVSNDADGADETSPTTAVAEADTSVGSCADAQLGDGAYLVSNIAANDPDGGLVGRAAPGPDQGAVDLLPADYGVFVDGDTASCALVGSAVWWNVNVGEGLTSWVNASFLARYSEVAEREAIGTTEALCDAYEIVARSQETDAFPTAALIRLNVELDFHPAGVSGAISDIIEGRGTAESYESINGYVGPICN